jgi:hypothetical protein
VRTLRRVEECADQPRIIEQRIDALVAKRGLALSQLTIVASRDESHRELRVVAGETMSDVGNNHVASSNRTSCT